MNWKERAEKAEAAETEYFRQYGIQYERAEKAEQQLNKAVALLREIHSTGSLDLDEAGWRRLDTLLKTTDPV